MGCCPGYSVRLTAETECVDQEWRLAAHSDYLGRRPEVYRTLASVHGVGMALSKQSRTCTGVEEPAGAFFSGAFDEVVPILPT